MKRLHRHFSGASLAAGAARGRRVSTMRVLLVGYGRMGRLVEAQCGQHGFEVVGRLDSRNNGHGEALSRSGRADVAIDFSTGPAFVENFPRLAARGTSVVVGTTGWRAHEAAFAAMAAQAGIGVVAAANFAPGAVLFEAIAAAAANLFAAHAEYGAWLHEAHHARKRDAPSGTALAIRAAMERAGLDRPMDVASTRAGSIPGTHTVGFDGPFDSVTLSHATRDRAVFAHGALLATRWLGGRRGWFTMRDVLGLPPGAR